MPLKIKVQMHVFLILAQLILQHIGYWTLSTTQLLHHSNERSKTTSPIQQFVSKTTPRGRRDNLNSCCADAFNHRSPEAGGVHLFQPIGGKEDHIHISDQSNASILFSEDSARSTLNAAAQPRFSHAPRPHHVNQNYDAIRGGPISINTDVRTTRSCCLRRWFVWFIFLIFFLFRDASGNV